MKKKIIISLILAMCCIVASVPVSAVVNDCVYHALEYAWCVRGDPQYIALTHYYQNLNGSSKLCNYQVMMYRAVEYCEECGETFLDQAGDHDHGEIGHNDCGWLNTYSERNCPFYEY